MKQQIFVISVINYLFLHKSQHSKKKQIEEIGTKMENYSSDDDNQSVSTYLKSEPSSSFTNGNRVTMVNSATFINSDSEDDDFDLDELDGGGDEKNSSTKIRKFIDLSPEALEERRKKHEQWMKEKLEREKRAKQIEKEKYEKEIEAQQEFLEERRQISQESVAKWMEKKKVEAEKKAMRLKKAEEEFLMRQAEMKEREAPKKKISYDEWIELKSAEVKNKSHMKTKEKKIVKIIENSRQIVSSKSFNDWLISTKSKPKPVPLNRGLDSLRGSSTKPSFINPQPWKLE